MKKLERYDVVGEKIVSVEPYHDGTEFTLSNGVTFDTSSIVRKKDKYIGRIIEEFLPYHDGVEIKLNGGINLDTGFNLKFKEPKHPSLINRVYNAAKKGNPDKERKAMDNLVGKSFQFLGIPCAVTSIKDYDLNEVRIKDSFGTRRKVNIYSLE